MFATISSTKGTRRNFKERGITYGYIGIHQKRKMTQNVYPHVFHSPTKKNRVFFLVIL